MSLSLLATDDPVLLGPELIGRLAAARSEQRPVVVLVPSFSTALEVSKELSSRPGLSIGVTATTPAAWARERWEVWGDGRTPIDPSTRLALAYSLVVLEGADAADGLSHTVGMVRSLCRLTREALAWLPGEPAVPLVDAEQAVVDLALRYRERIEEHGYIEPCQIMADLPRIFAAEGVAMPLVAVAGFDDVPFATIAFLSDLAAICPLVVQVCDDGSPQTELGRRFATDLEHATAARGVTAEHLTCTRTAPSGTGELSILSHAIFRAGEQGVARPVATGAVRRAIAAGPFAEPELIVREAARLASEGAEDVVICAPDPGTAWDALAPRLAARGLAVEGTEQRALRITSAGRAFIAFARCVSDLVEADRAWDAPVPGQLPPMDWWPPRTLTDFLLSSISGVSEDAAWAIDKRLRGNRALAPREVLALLQREGTTSHACARATRLVAEGRIGSAAHLLARELVEAGGDPASDEVFALEAIAQIQASAAHLGLSAQGADAFAVGDLVEMLDALCMDLAATGPRCLGPADASCTVRICSRAEAAQLAPASVDAVIFMQLTSAQWPLKQKDDALTRLMRNLGVASAYDPLAQARHRFARALAAARTTVVVERSVRDHDAKATYPAVVLSELLAAYGEGAELPSVCAAEDEPAAKLSASGTAPSSEGVVVLPEQDCIQDRSMLVLRRGDAGPQAAPLSLSATQIENYLACPLKWYTQNRIKIDGIDADFTNMQKGSFAHVVLERTHRELLRRAAVGSGLIGADDPAEAVRDAFVPGARVASSNLDEAINLLDRVFDEHLEAQRARALRRESQSLVPHTASEAYQVELLRRDLHASLAFEAQRLDGFEPRFFELRFGSGEGCTRVTYAGAEIVGTIDRIDVGPHGEALIIDYKHKGSSSFASEYDIFPSKGPGEGFSIDAFELPQHIQALAYAQIVRRLHPELHVVGAVFLSTMGAKPADHVIAGLADASVLPRILGEEGASRREAAMCPPPGITFEALLDATEERVAQVIARLAEGRIEACPRTPESCRFCPVLRCERRM